MALTLIQRETFQGVGTLNAASPGNLGTVVTGSFCKRAVGPRLTDDTTADSKGWSADMQLTNASGGSAYHTYAVPASAAQTIGMISSFYYIDSFTNNGGNTQQLINTIQVNTNQLLLSIIDSSTGNFFYNRAGLWASTNSGIAVPIKQWFEMRLAWQNTGGQNYRVHLMYRLAGSASWITIYLMDTPFSGGSTIATARGGAPNTTGSSGFF